tara:strand:- start:505 stop:882 length:378 start_codon:yes stop_codon:yes gene_type:complete
LNYLLPFAIPQYPLPLEDEDEDEVLLLLDELDEETDVVDDVELDVGGGVYDVVELTRSLATPESRDPSDSADTAIDPDALESTKIIASFSAYALLEIESGAEKTMYSEFPLIDMILRFVRVATPR